jgi:hypothetical protein
VIEKKGRSTTGFWAFLALPVGGDPHPPMFLKRYDSKGVRGWGPANDIIPWELDEQPSRAGDGREGIRKCELANTGENSMPVRIG